MEYNEGMIPNKNRIIRISCSNSGSKNGGGQWYNTFSRIFGNDSSVSGNNFIVKDKDFTKWDAAVPLLMDDNISPMGDITYTPKTPINDFLSGNSTLTGIKSMDSVIGDIGKGLNMAGSVVVDGLEAVKSFSNTSYTAQTYYPWIKNIGTFDPNSVTPPEISCNFKFNMGQYGLWNAKEEVFKPMLNLMSMVMVREISSSISMRPPYPTTMQLFINTIQSVFTDFSNIGDELSSGWENAKSEATADTGSKINDLANAASSIVNSIANVLEDLLTSNYKNYTYDVSFGSAISFYDMLPVSINGVSFSSETDQYGFPISGSIGIGFKGIKPYSLSSKHGNVAMRFGGK